ncbi:hypothetical protein LX32DRAFT_371570 [Colletotrichum zoysiae]|uniref:Uncharacterized protein n=1 Tax=Colletotrichum zoysiae TaxID=1216348 RepID=A0AAD9HT09_9PEZI|nr:hypothetical protein LX32DRAFT_371570 [Colletotrichum zoysiae]
MSGRETQRPWTPISSSPLSPLSLFPLPPFFPLSRAIQVLLLSPMILGGQPRLRRLCKQATGKRPIGSTAMVVQLIFSALVFTLFMSSVLFAFWGLGVLESTGWLYY